VTVDVDTDIDLGRFLSIAHREPGTGSETGIEAIAAAACECRTSLIHYLTCISFLEHIVQPVRVSGQARSMWRGFLRDERQGGAQNGSTKRKLFHWFSPEV